VDSFAACGNAPLCVHLSVPAWAHSSTPAAGRAHSSKPSVAGLLLLARLAGVISRLLHGAQQRGVWRAHAGSAMLLATDMELGHCVTRSMGHLGHLSLSGHPVTGSSF